MYIILLCIINKYILYICMYQNNLICGSFVDFGVVPTVHDIVINTNIQFVDLESAVLQSTKRLLRKFGI